MKSSDSLGKKKKKVISFLSAISVVIYTALELLGGGVIYGVPNDTSTFTPQDNLQQ